MNAITGNIPAILAAVGAIVAAWYARRSQHETNASADWQAFVKAQAELLIRPLREKLEQAERDIAELKTKLADREDTVARLRFELRAALAFIRALLTVLAERKIKAPKVPEAIQEQMNDGI
ncbi:hypothetical protein IU500_12470 [Nocardia terpenica]|uniref:hypothetical protein n=1 Tax=Nocardia terpenica TaxID=455432 RepID=UPI001892DD4F|nr:hypothetical protein [Nocardia terpenica]MBF6063008.1 hypothetical protein [Nocardia terpenica]MBF6104857.1 hypothetical protein [Nocardia terpenica]MBF6112706.1 hypothetical protein [Nocardia terpenica]MBF6118585.1 hypothetical protein [Nocardia terpenica]MBF6155064.1 hypothetical protein [Nocardia terpenica]